MRFCDELPDGSFGWLEDERPYLRCAHALVADGRVYVVDPFEAARVEERVRAAGEPAGVIQLLDRHRRDCAAFARRLGVPLHVLDAPAPFVPIPLRTPPRWKEIALWWPEPRVLVAADALGTVPSYFVAPGEQVGVHPLLRLVPPRRLARLAPQRILVGHGEGVHEDATAAMREALRTARSRIPALLRQALSGAAGRRGSSSR